MTMIDYHHTSSILHIMIEQLDIFSCFYEKYVFWSSHLGDAILLTLSTFILLQTNCKYGFAVHHYIVAKMQLIILECGHSKEDCSKWSSRFSTFLPLSCVWEAQQGECWMDKIFDFPL